jgi:excisionase family DNA binding protein
MSEGPKTLAVNYDEAGKMLGVCSRTVWSLVNSHQISAFRCGRSVRIPVSELESFIARQVASNGEGGAENE